MNRGNSNNSHIKKKEHSYLKRTEFFCDMTMSLSTGLGVLITALTPKVNNLTFKASSKDCYFNYVKFSRWNLPYFVLNTGPKWSYTGIVTVYGFILGLLFTSSIVKYRSKNNKSTLIFGRTSEKENSSLIKKVIIYALLVILLLLVAAILVDYGTIRYAKYNDKLPLLIGAFIIASVMFLIVVNDMKGKASYYLEYVFEGSIIVISLILISNAVWIVLLIFIYAVITILFEVIPALFRLVFKILKMFYILFIEYLLIKPLQKEIIRHLKCILTILWLCQ